MVKHIKIPVEDDEHEEWLKVKGKHTWYYILQKGVEVLVKEARKRG